MAATTHPGVYIEELPSGARTLTGVPTSTTAFIGRARRGPVNRPVRVRTAAEYAGLFGGLWQPAPMSYAVTQFFDQGGGDALVVRVFNGSVEGSTATITLPTADAPLVLEAAGPGAWGQALRATVDHGTDEADPRLFNLIVEELDGPGGTNVRAAESFRNVSVAPGSPRFGDSIVNATSQLVRIRQSAPANTRPVSGTFAAAGGTGDDGAAIADAHVTGNAHDHTGMFALEETDSFNLLCIPPLATDTDVAGTTWAAAAAYCQRRRAMLIIDAPAAWRTSARGAITSAAAGIDSLRRTVGHAVPNAAVYFPRLRMADPLDGNRIADFAPCGAVAGIIARTDAQRGVWKAPAGTEASFSGIDGFTCALTDTENGQLNSLGLNCLRSLPAIGHLVWGARTLAGADALSSEWKYLPVRRLALFLEDSLYRGTRWAALEPNDEPLWGQIRLIGGAFLQDLFRAGAFAGTTPREAYFVTCDRETTTRRDIESGIVNVVIGFAPLKPAEFVIVEIRQSAKSSDDGRAGTGEPAR